jgi:hypothetical protein
MAIDLTGSAGDFGNIIAAIGALGVAAYGLVDATKAFRGGVSNIGLPFLTKALRPYVDALLLVDADDPYVTIRANWLNGVPSADQKAAAKALIHLGLTPATAARLAAGTPGIEAEPLVTVATKLSTGEPLADIDLNLLGRFDTIVDAQLDAAFERADQQYRNVAKLLAAAFAIVLSLVGVWIVEKGAVSTSDFLLALLVGVIATPLAPVAKDVTSAISSAVSAIKSVKG